MNKLLKSVIGLTAIPLIGGVLAGPAVSETRELRYAMGHPPGSFVVDAGQAYADAVGEYSNGELSVKVYAMSLLNMAETSAGLRDGIADIGFVLTPYFPAEYPHTNLLSESSMLLRLYGDKIVGKEGLAYIGAMSEFVFNHCPECNEEFAEQNQVYTGQTGGSSYGLVCRTPVKSLDDLKGKRMRVGAGNWSRWVESVGGVGITMSANEMNEALSQGVVDCIVLSAPEIHNFGLTEAVTDITMAVPGGIFTTAGTNVNADVWRSLTEDQRRAMLHAATVEAAQIPFVYHQREDEVLDGLRERGVGFHDADDELVEVTQTFIEQDMDTLATHYSEKYGVERSAEMLSDFRPILDKWVELVQEIDSVDSLADLYWEEVFSKVDVSSHGL
ncbi:C4-dicarboxylate TRAP transporter substrate-binding protein [Marinobacter segnicrescens]|uniref:TRAP-type C4-dicarboxylate transport system, substrate-binding protein n=2 Tax=Marinobacter TaxID=2742 RepID=A0A1I0HUQ5_9GAMM|nr:C4-dicarboxylate TRAP transporter substrate-binding protein [Marinobacter segnicrescens]SET86911.1 TRAP-type C4-dicarboxylate transport system, substrate-binding protein [Marinobacter segnicrescens]